MKVCDKCRKPVAPENDAVVLDVITGHLDPFTAAWCYPRHLLPTDDCVGSPSRAQYLDGQERDTRGYVYDPEGYGKAVRQAYEQMQLEARRRNAIYN